MATLVRLDPLREVATMHNELSRLMNGLFEGNGRATLVYAFDLPGILQEKISIEVEDNVLTVSAERELAKEVARESYHRLERRYGTFARSVGLPQGVSDEGIRATFADGVLEVHVPKPEQSKPKRIQIGTPAEQKTIEG